MSENPIVENEQGLEQLKKLVTDSLTSPHSRAAYDKALTDFLAWYQSTGQRGLIKATVAEY